VKLWARVWCLVFLTHRVKINKKQKQNVSPRSAAALAGLVNKCSKCCHSAYIHGLHALRRFLQSLMAASTMVYLLTVPGININDALLQFINVLTILTSRRSSRVAWTAATHCCSASATDYFDASTSDSSAKKLALIAAEPGRYTSKTM